MVCDIIRRMAIPMFGEFGTGRLAAIVLVLLALLGLVVPMREVSAIDDNTGLSAFTPGAILQSGRRVHIEGTEIKAEYNPGTSGSSDAPLGGITVQIRSGAAAGPNPDITIFLDTDHLSILSCPSCAVYPVTPTELADGIEYHYTINQDGDPYSDGGTLLFATRLTVRISLLIDGIEEGRNAAGINVGEIVRVTLHTTPNETAGTRGEPYTGVVTLTVSDILPPPDVVYKIGDVDTETGSLPNNTIDEAVVTNVSVRLSAEPSGNVTLVPSVVANTGIGARVSFPGTADIRFTTANWETFQTLPVLISRDGHVDTSASFAIRLQGTSADPSYSGIIEPALFFGQVDNTDPLGFAISVPTDTIITVGTDPITVRVSLQSRLTAPNVVDYEFKPQGAVSDYAGVYSSLPRLPFSGVLFNGHDEFSFTALVPGAVTILARASAANLITVYTPATLKLEVVEDTEFFEVSPRVLSGFDFREGAEADGSTNSETVMVQLTGAPTSAVTVSLALNAAASADISVPDNELVFTSANWSVPQPFVLSAVDDGVVEVQEEIMVTYRAYSSHTGFDGKSIVQMFSLKDKLVTPFVAFDTPAGGRLPAIEEGESITVTLSLSHPAVDPVVVDIWTEDNHAEVALEGATLNQVISSSQVATVIRTTLPPSQLNTYTVTIHTSNDASWSGVSRSYRLRAAIISGMGAYATVAANPVANRGRTFGQISDFGTGYALAHGVVEEDDHIVSSNPAEIILRKGTTVAIAWNVLARKLPGVPSRTGSPLLSETRDLNVDVDILITLTTANRVGVPTSYSPTFIFPYSPGPGTLVFDFTGIRDVTPSSAMPQFDLTAGVLPVYPQPVDVLVSLQFKNIPRLTNLPVALRRVTLVAGWVTDPELQFDPKTLPVVVEGSSTQVAFHLGEPPSSAVMVSVSADGATFDTSEFVFSPSNWQTAKNLRITAVDDGVVEDNEVINITYTISSADADYNGKRPIQALTVEDNPASAMPGLVLAPDTLPALAEGATRTVMVRLAIAPQANVNVAVGVSDTSELSFSPASLVFSTTNWETAQPVILTGVEDSVVDGTKQVMVTLDASSPGDPAYNALPDVIRSLDVTDGNAALFTFIPSSLPFIDEEGETSTATVTVRLGTAAEGGVTLSFTSLYPAAASLTAASIPATLTTTAQEATVTLFAIPNDVDIQGSAPYGLRVSGTGPGAYAGLTGSTTGGVEDDDAAFLLVTPASVPGLDEGSTFQVMAELLSEPPANVTVAITSSDEGELTVSTGRLDFTAADWNMPQIVVLSGVEDSVTDGNQSVVVTYDVFSSDIFYATLPNITQQVNVIDVVPRGLVLTPDTLPALAEGATSTVMVKLAAAPSANVTVAVSSSDTSDLTVNPASLVFSTTNWETARPVTLSGLRDGVLDGRKQETVTYNLSSTGDTDYNALPNVTRSLDIDDRTIPSFDFAGLKNIPENGGKATVIVSLDEADVSSEVTLMLAFTSLDPTVATLSPASIPITLTTTADEATVTLGAVNDNLNTGNRLYGLRVLVVSGTGYGDGFSFQQGDMVIEDDAPVPGLVLTPDTLTALDEGATRTVMVKLRAAPSANVTVAVGVSDPSELSFSPPSLVFSTTNWETAQPVMLTGVEDSLVDGTKQVMVTYAVSSLDSGYGTTLNETQSLDVTDSNFAGLNFDPATLPSINENGGMATVTVGLVTAVEGGVTLAFTSPGPATPLSVTPLRATLTMLADKVTVTLSVVDDFFDNGNRPYRLRVDAVSGPGDFDGYTQTAFGINVIDDDVAALVLDPSTLPGLAEGSTFQVMAMLNSEPTANVTVAITSSDEGELTVSTARLEFSADDWNMPQIVVLSGVEDSVADGAQSVEVTYDVSSSDPIYSTLPNITQQVNVTEAAAEPGLVLAPDTLTALAEGATSTVMVKLRAAPSANVNVAVGVSDSSELTVDPTSLVFTDANWNVALPVTLSGVEDNLVDGTKQVTVTYAVSSLDSGYGSSLNETQSLNVTDGNTASFTFDPSPLTDIDEFGIRAVVTVSVRLGTAVETGVELAFTSIDTTAATLTAASIPATLTTTSDEAVVSLFATGPENIDNPINRIYGLRVSVTSGPPGYAGLLQTITASVIDDDTAGLVLDPPTLSALAERATLTVMVNLATQPATQNVTVDVTSSDESELTVSTARLVFMTGNWNTPQPVTLLGVADSLVDGTQAVAVTYAVSSDDNGYGPTLNETQSLNVTNTDAAQIRFVGRHPDLPEGGTAIVEVQLVTGAEEPVLLGVWPKRADRVTLSSPTVTVTVQAAGDTRMVTVYGVDNNVDFDDGSSTFPQLSYSMTLSVLAGPGLFVDLPAIREFGALIDDDMAGLALVPSETSLSDLAEGETATVMVKLESQPTVNVNVSVSVSDTTELEVSPANLVFTSTNWDTSKPVVLTGKTDSLVDGSKPVTVTYDFVTNDFAYDHLPNVTQELVVTDAQVAGIVGLPETLPTILESNGMAKVTLHLAAAAEGGVTLAFTSLFPAVATLSATSVSATLIATADKATVTITAIDDNSPNSPRNYALRVSVVGGPGGYDGLALTVFGTVSDDDAPNLVLDPFTLPALAEDATSMVMVKLATEPSAIVTVAVSSSETGEATVSPARLEFTPTDWDMEQAVVLTGVGDSLVDGTQAVVLTYALSSDDTTGYAALADVTQPLDVTDADVAGLGSDPSPLPNINENGGTAVVEVRLSVAAETGVKLTITSLIPGVATLTSPLPLLATLTTLDDRATVTLGAVDNVATDGDRDYALLVSVMSGPGGYSGLTLTVAGMVNDDDVPSLVLDPSAPSLPNLAEGAKFTVSVSLATEPTGTVTVDVSSADPDDPGDTGEVSLSPARLEFTATDWSTPKPVVLTGVEDDLVDGTQAVVVTYAVSSDGIGYGPTLNVTQSLDVTDGNTGGFTFIPSSLPDIDETGGLATVTVRLSVAAEPGVTLVFSSFFRNFATLSAVSITAALTTTLDEAVVTLFAVPNNIDRPFSQSYSLDVTVTHGPGSYDGRRDSVGGFVTDDDVAALVLDPSTATLPDLAEGETSTVMVKLATQPVAIVTVDVSSSDSSELTVSLTRLEFMASNWNTPQPVVLTGREDSLIDGIQAVTVTYALSSNDVPYGALPNVTQALNVTDAPNLLLDPPSLTTVAEGATSTVSVMLATEPTGTVTVDVSSADPADPADIGEVSLSTARLEFTATNWSTPRPVVLTGVEDNLVDGTQAVVVTYDISSTDGSAYNDLDSVTQSLDVTDADVAGFVVIPASLPDINELGGKVTVTVRLSIAAEPGVMLVFTSPDAAATLFTAESITAVLIAATDEATVTLGAVDNSVASGDQTYALKVSVMSGPVGYSGLELTVFGTVVDDDSPNLVLAPSSLPALDEVGTSQVSVMLATQPTIDVTVAVSSSDPGELTVSPAQLEFSSADWNMAKAVTLSGRDDNFVDGTQTVAVTYAVSSSDSGYGGLAARTQSQEVTDSDMGGLALEPAALPPLNEPDGVATVSLRLTKSSSSPVTLAVWSSATVVATLSSATVTLALMSELDRGEVALGVVDNTATGNRSYELRVSVVGGVGGYADVDLTAVGIVIDDDAAEVFFVPAGLPRIDEGGSLTVSVALGATPTAPVTLEVSSRNTLVATLSPATVAITLDGTRMSAPVTVGGVSNALLADQAYMLTVSVVGSGSDYNGQVASASGIVASDDVALVAEPAELGDIPSEAGSVTVELRLGADPAMEVTVNIGNAAPTGATLLGASQTQTFMMDDLTDRVTVTLAAVNDGGVYPREFGLLVTVTTGNAPDAGFNTVLALMGMVQGDPGLLLSPGTLADLAEGATSQVTVRLALQPSANVTVSVSSSDQSELTVNPTRLEFTAANWNVPRTVTLSGVEDRLVDGTKQVMVTYAVSSSGDSEYDRLSNVIQSLDVTDADTAGLRADPPTLPNINEEGEMSTARVTLRLMTAAEGGVVLTITSPDAAATLSSMSLATLRTLSDRVRVTLGAVANSAKTGDQGYSLLVSVVSGPVGYAGLALSISGMVLDDDVPNLLLAPTTLPNVTEDGETQVMVQLATEPSAIVTVAVASDASGELSVSPASLEFTAADWNVAKAVVLSGVEDSLVDGLKQVMVTYAVSSDDIGYGPALNVTQPLNVTDVDVAGLVADPPTLPSISENGGTAVVTLSLVTAAEGGVTLSFTSSFPAVATLSATPLSVTLSPPADIVSVTLGAVNDDIDSNDRGYALKVVVSGPGGYDGLELTVTGSVTDDDQANLVLTPSSLPTLAETGTSQVMVNLATQPTSDVTVAVSSSDTGELSVSPAEIVFTDSDWNTAKAVTLSGAEDNLVDGSQTVEVTYAVSSSDSGYGGLAARTQSQEVTDSDMGGLALVPAAGSLPPLSEPDGVATVSLRLTKPSSLPVTLAVWSSNTLVATLSSTTVTLTLMNELDRGEVALGVVDNTGTGVRSYGLRASVVGGVGGYAGVGLTVLGTVFNDDAAGVRFVPAALPSIDEGGSLTVSVALGATPNAPVTLEVSSRNTLVATLSPATVLLTLEGPLASAPVTVGGVTNALLADQAYELTVSVVGSDD